jgi:hypothetical protein
VITLPCCKAFVSVFYIGFSSSGKISVVQ